MIQFGEDSYKESLKALWKQCFPQDTDDFIAFYFEKVYKHDETLIYLENRRPIASLQMIPYTIQTGATIHPSGYLSGVMTHPDYRGKGYMAKLLHAAFDAMKQKACDYTFLIPQEEWLTSVYAKFGFKQGYTVNGARCTIEDTSPLTVHRAPFTVNPSPFTVYQNYHQLLMEKENVVLKTGQQFEYILEDFYNDQGILFSGEEGMAFTLQQENRIILKEILYTTEAGKDELLKTIRLHYRLDEIVFPNDNKGMIKKLNPVAEDITNLYMGMMLD
jgi:predicted acetyltransferase